ncbi:MAG TPA: hypothetical protein VIG33_17760 [Pseudobdellovibrionaceae bacterium]
MTAPSQKAGISPAFSIFNIFIPLRLNLTQVLRALADKSFRFQDGFWKERLGMFLQGDLQTVFDALYTIGAIDPVLKLDWEQVLNEMAQNPEMIVHAMDVINACDGDKDLMVQRLHMMDVKVVNYIAMEVAREFVEFQDRSCLH